MFLAVAFARQCTSYIQYVCGMLSYLFYISIQFINVMRCKLVDIVLTVAFLFRDYNRSYHEICQQSYESALVAVILRSIDGRLNETVLIRCWHLTTRLFTMCLSINRNNPHRKASQQSDMNIKHIWNALHRQLGINHGTNWNICWTQFVRYRRFCQWNSLLSRINVSSVRPIVLRWIHHIQLALNSGLFNRLLNHQFRTCAKLAVINDQ